MYSLISQSIRQMVVDSENFVDESRRQASLVSNSSSAELDRTQILDGTRADSEVDDSEGEGDEADSDDAEAKPNLGVSIKGKSKEEMKTHKKLVKVKAWISYSAIIHLFLFFVL